MALAAGGLAVLPALPLAAQFMVCLPAVALLGLPHGATDWWIAAERMPALVGSRHWFAWVPLFGAGYLLLGLAAAGVIFVSPAAALIGFVAVSAWHFGDTDCCALSVDGPASVSIPAGLLPISAPALFWPQQVAGLVAALGVNVPIGDVAMAGACGVFVAIAVPAWRLAAKGARLRREQAALLLLGATAPPLLGFLVYFCAIHAPRQAARLAIRGSEAVAWLVAALAAGIIAAVFFGHTAATVTLPHEAAQALFWGLAILTLPHVACGYLLGGEPGGLDR
jgi:Brp/Blh family beta-carotene 15,15'-monooxygenase